MNSTKRCIRCDGVKQIGQFYKNSRMADGHVGVCISCKKRAVSDRKAKYNPSVISILLDGWKRANQESDNAI